MSDTNKIGSFVGTGAILNVDLGFVPAYVELFNPNDAGSLMPSLTRFSGMAAASGFKTKSITDNATTTNKSSEYITANGLSDFLGELPGKALVGTIAVTAGLKALVGTSTLFLTDLRVGDVVTLGGNQYTIAGVTTATAATIVEVAVKTETVGLMTRVTGRAAGFTLGAETDLNVSGEAVFYAASK
jgi:hypothetical protein